MAMIHVCRQDPVSLERCHLAGHTSDSRTTRGSDLGKQAGFVIAEFIHLFYSFLECVSVLETEQDPIVLPHNTVSSACLLSVESFSQKVSLIREMRCWNKGKQSKESKQ